ncbi:MAG: hypothetical protein HUJ68_10545 [Clostridia bacterium]|nr:hypothetical protein [Clostridia bacterium]
MKSAISNETVKLSKNDNNTDNIYISLDGCLNYYGSIIIGDLEISDKHNFIESFRTELLQYVEFTPYKSLDLIPSAVILNNFGFSFDTIKDQYSRYLYYKEG